MLAEDLKIVIDGLAQPNCLRQRNFWSDTYEPYVTYPLNFILAPILVLKGEK